MSLPHPCPDDSEVASPLESCMQVVPTTDAAAGGECAAAAAAPDDDDDGDEMEASPLYEAAGDMSVPVSVSGLRQSLQHARQRAQAAQDAAVAAASAQQASFAAASLQVMNRAQLVARMSLAIVTSIFLAFRVLHTCSPAKCRRHVKSALFDGLCSLWATGGRWRC